MNKMCYPLTRPWIREELIEANTAEDSGVTSTIICYIQVSVSVIVIGKVSRSCSRSRSRSQS